MNTNSETTTSPASDDLEKIKEERKSKVRVYVTYAAASFLFAGGPLLIAFFIWTHDRVNALALFNTILPVSAAIISYWFAGRTNNKK